MTDQTTNQTDQTPGSDAEPADVDGFGPETIQYWKTRARANEKRAKANAEAAKALQDLTAERDQLRAELDQTSQTLTQVERDQLRAEVAAEHGLPPALAKRLQGDDRDELVADAQALAEQVRPVAVDRRPREALRRVALDDDGAALASAHDEARRWFNQTTGRPNY